MKKESLHNVQYGKKKIGSRYNSAKYKRCIRTLDLRSMIIQRVLPRNGFHYLVRNEYHYHVYSCLRRFFFFPFKHNVQLKE